MERPFDRDAPDSNRHRGMSTSRRPVGVHEHRRGRRYISELRRHGPESLHRYDRSLNARRRSQTMFDSARHVSVAGGGISQVGAGGVVVHVHQPRTAHPHSQHHRRLHQSPRILALARHNARRSAAGLNRLNGVNISSTTKSDFEIYHDQLITKRRGTPLWMPGPNQRLPKAYRRRGLDIGDVGMFTDLGAFCFLFNIFEEADSEINRGKVPAEFTPLRRACNREPGAEVGWLDDVQEFRVNGTWIGSEGVKEEVAPAPNGFTFTTRASEGAILTMPLGASSKDLTPTRLLKKYVADNLESWYRYVIHERQQEVENGQLRLVCGCDKSSSWGIAAFRHEQNSLSDEEAKKMHFGPHRQGGEGTYAWSCMSGGSGRVGPDESELRDLLVVDDPDAMEVDGEIQPEPAGGTLIENQCLFVRTMNAQCNTVEWQRVMDDGLLADANNHSAQHHPELVTGRGNPDPTRGNQPGGPPLWGSRSHSNWAMDIQFTPMDGQPKLNVHPSDKLNNAMLEKYPEASVVVTEDEDWLWATNQRSDEPTVDDMLPFKEVTLKDGALYLERCNLPILHDMPKMKSRPTLKPHSQYYSVHGNLRIVVGHTLFKLRRQNLSRYLRRLICELSGKDSRGNLRIEHLDGDQFAHFLEQLYTHPSTKPHSHRSSNLSRTVSHCLVSRPTEAALGISNILKQDTRPTHSNSATKPSQLPHQRLVHNPSFVPAALSPPEMKRREGVFTPFKPQKSDLIIMVIGTTGAGKSTFVNAVAGYEASQASDELHSCTREVKPIACQHHEGRRVVMVDTPGFNDTHLSDMDVFRLVANWLKETYEEGIKLSGVLLFHRITDNRLTGAARKLLDIFKDTCGPDALRNALLVTTMWDEIDEAQGLCREQELVENFWSAMIARGARVERFLNTDKSALEIVSLLAKDALQYPLLLQRELVDERKDLARTTAGKSVFGWLNDLLAGIQKKIEAIAKKLQRATKKGDIAQEHQLQGQLKTVKEEEAYVDRELKWYRPEQIQIHDQRWTSAPFTLSPISISTSASSTSLPPWSFNGSTLNEHESGVETTVLPPSSNCTPSPSILLHHDDWTVVYTDDAPLYPSESLNTPTSVDTASASTGSSSTSTTNSTSSSRSSLLKRLRRSSSSTTVSKGSSNKNIVSQVIARGNGQNIVRRMTKKRRNEPMESSQVAVGQVGTPQKAATS